MAQDHINDALQEHDIQEAAKWVVRPVYAAPQAVPAWLPIESAPKDGSEFLAWWDDGKGSKHRGVRTTHYLDNSKTRTPWAGWIGPSMAVVHIGLKPTHWMPLPAAPKGAV